MVIAIDGPACAGKSTLAVLTAKKLNINFLNTGMIFRAIAYYLTKNNITNTEIDKIEEYLEKADIDVEYIDGEQHVYVNGEDTLMYVNLPEYSEKASLYSQIQQVRNTVCNIQRNFAKKYDLVVEGRDIGTEVFPNAEYKFFLTASIESRAKRRYKTLIEKGEDVTYEQICEMLEQRDYNDTHRKISPLKKADDAICIDTSLDTVEESLNKILSYITK